MKLHADAALTLDRRCRLCERVSDEQWTFMKRRRGGRGQRPHGAQWMRCDRGMRCDRAEGDARLVDRPECCAILLKLGLSHLDDVRLRVKVARIHLEDADPDRGPAPA